MAEDDVWFIFVGKIECRVRGGGVRGISLCECTAETIVGNDMRQLW